jgi:hypothetical protein
MNSTAHLGAATQAHANSNLAESHTACVPTSLSEADRATSAPHPCQTWPPSPPMGSMWPWFRCCPNSADVSSPSLRREAKSFFHSAQPSLCSMLYSTSRVSYLLAPRLLHASMSQSPTGAFTAALRWASSSPVRTSSWTARLRLGHHLLEDRTIALMLPGPRVGCPGYSTEPPSIGPHRPNAANVETPFSVSPVLPAASKLFPHPT